MISFFQFKAVSKIYKDEGKRSFTLIELLVVISIIGLLASVVLAGLSNTKTSADEVKALSDMQEIRRILQLYATDHQGYYPFENVDGGVYAYSINGATWSAYKCNTVVSDTTSCTSYTSMTSAFNSELGKYASMLPRNPNFRYYFRSNYGYFSTNCRTSNTFIYSYHSNTTQSWNMGNRPKDCTTSATLASIKVN